MGFYYDQGFYYNQPDQGFYYDKNEEGFYYDQEKEGFYYDQDKGFYYEGFYYDGFYYNQPQGFYYDERDAGFNQGNKDYWYKGDGKKRMLAALNGIRTRVDDHILKNPSPPNDAQGRALSNIVTTDVCRNVIEKFVTNVNPNEFFKNGGDDKKLAILLVKEIQEHLGPLHDYRKAWRQEGSNAKKAMDAVTNNLIPFMVTWVADQEFHTPNGNQDAACQKLVATRLVDEAFYEYACNTNPSFCSGDAEKQEKQAEELGRDLADVVLRLVQKETKAK